MELKNPAKLEPLYLLLHKLGKITKPKTYLEIGTYEGASASSLLVSNEEMTRHLWRYDGTLSEDVIEKLKLALATSEDQPKLYLFDNWSYRANELLVRSLLTKVFNANFEMFAGDSHQTVSKFFRTHGGIIDLCLVDGDHTDEGALKDLEDVYSKCKIIVFHDITHPSCPGLKKVFLDFCDRHDLKHYETSYMCGMGLAVDLNLYPGCPITAIEDLFE